MATRSTTKPKATSPKAGPKPKVYVVEDLMHFRTKSGDEIILDLDFPSDILRAVMLEDLTEREQFEKIIEALGSDELQECINELGSLEYMRLVTSFFDEFQKAAGLSAGESSSSSTSSTSTE